jgi:hypothetical protein
VRLTDEAWRSAFESVFLGAVRLARILAADLGGAGDGRGADRNAPKARRQALADPSVGHPGNRGSSSRPVPARRSPAIPRITSDIIRESRYELVRAPDHAETRAWHVLVSGKVVGLVRPTWRGERGRPGWEPVTSAR